MSDYQERTRSEPRNSPYNKPSPQVEGGRRGGGGLRNLFNIIILTFWIGTVYWYVFSRYMACYFKMPPALGFIPLCQNVTNNALYLLSLAVGLVLLPLYLVVVYGLNQPAPSWTPIQSVQAILAGLIVIAVLIVLPLVFFLVRRVRGIRERRSKAQENITILSQEQLVEIELKKRQAEEWAA